MWMHTDMFMFHMYVFIHVWLYMHGFVSSPHNPSNTNTSTLAYFHTYFWTAGVTFSVWLRKRWDVEIHQKMCGYIYVHPQVLCVV